MLIESDDDKGILNSGGSYSATSATVSVQAHSQLDVWPFPGVLRMLLILDEREQKPTTHLMN